MEVPNLDEKINLLLRYDNIIKTRSKLAEELGGINPSNITQWVKGNAYGKMNYIPGRHVPDIERLFKLQPSWLKETDIDTFEALLQQRNIYRSPWQTLLLQLESSKGLTLKRRPGRGRSRLNYQDSVKSHDEPFYPYERVYIELNLEDRWVSVTTQEVMVYAVVLWTANSDIRCLCPSEASSAPKHQWSERKMLIPINAPAECLIVEPLYGVHTIIALLTRHPISHSIYEELRRQEPVDLLPALDTLARSLQQASEDSWQCLKFNFFVQPEDTEYDES